MTVKGNQLGFVKMYCVFVQCLTLDDGQKDDNHEKEEGDVEDDAIDLVLVASRVLDLVPDPPTCSHANIHVEHVALGDRVGNTGGGKRKMHEEVIGLDDQK